MDFMPIKKLGPHADGHRIHFGILLPGLDTKQGFKIEIRVIHEKDQFIQGRLPYRQSLVHSMDPVYGDYWETIIDLSKPGNGKNWGTLGRYIYRYALIKPNGTEIDWIIDPFSRQFGVGRHAAFTFGYQDYKWDVPEAQWKTPKQSDLIMYEMNIMEFAGSLLQTTDRLEYLQDLGINCISLMPVTNISDAIDWGYTPIGYFGVDERFGKRRDFQQFVDHAHQHGIAVLVDAIYGHTSSLFGYEYLYRHLPEIANPMMGSFSKDMFGPSVDWTRTFAQDFFYTVNRHWLEVFHVDGFRYDCVPNYWELGPHFRGYASIAYHTHQWVKSQIEAENPLYKRFSEPEGSIRLIQCAEQLEAVKDVLDKTYSTCSWQNQTISAAESVVKDEPDALERLGKQWGAMDLPTEITCNNDRLYKAPLQYIENHDQNRFICNFGTINPDANGNALFEQGDRSQWFKVQPYLIGTLMSKGIPLLWQGQELCESSKIAPGGTSRTGFLRIVHWEYFYDTAGKSILTLVRKLTRIRRNLPHIKDGDHHFFNHSDRYQNQGVLLFARYYPGSSNYTLIALNFTPITKKVPFWFPIAGNYQEELHGHDYPELNLTGVSEYREEPIEIPSNYGRIWTHTDAVI